jgi:hypothetical protein
LTSTSQNITKEEDSARSRKTPSEPNLTIPNYINSRLGDIRDGHLPGGTVIIPSNQMLHNLLSMAFHLSNVSAERLRLDPLASRGTLRSRAAGTPYLCAQVRTIELKTDQIAGCFGMLVKELRIFELATGSPAELEEIYPMPRS